MAESKVTVMLAAAGTDAVTYQMQPPFLSDARFVISAAVTQWSQFEQTLNTMRPQLLVVQTDIAPGADQLINVLKHLQLWNGVAIVALPQALRELRGAFEQVSSVRSVFIGAAPNWAEVAQAGFAAVMTEQARTAASAPLQQAYLGRTATAVTGTRVVAFVSGSGGVGRSTLAENLAYELAHRMNIKTLLMSFDLPATVVAHLPYKFYPNALEYFHRPGDGFMAAIQAKAEKKEDDPLHVLVAPENTADYIRAGEYSAANKAAVDSIYSLVQTAWGRNYAAVLLDLPAGPQAWTMQGIMAANTAVIVTRPTLADLAATRHTMILLLERLVSEHRIPREAISMVFNQVNERSPMTPSSFHGGLVANYGWAPSVSAVIPFDPAVTQAQDAQTPPVARVDAFAKGVRSLATALFPGGATAEMGDASSAGQRGLFRLPKIKFT
jgi:Flp pilus assembly CpaE family ATPase